MSTFTKESLELLLLGIRNELQKSCDLGEAIIQADKQLAKMLGSSKDKVGHREKIDWMVAQIKTPGKLRERFMDLVNNSKDQSIKYSDVETILNSFLTDLGVPFDLLTNKVSELYSKKSNGDKFLKCYARLFKNNLEEYRKQQKALQAVSHNPASITEVSATQHSSDSDDEMESSVFTAAAQ